MSGEPKPELLQAIESISGELELRPLLEGIVRRACELIGADKGVLGLVDEPRQLIRIEAAYQMPAAEIGAEMPPGVGLAGQVLLTRQPVLLNHSGATGQPAWPELSEHALIGLPILRQERLTGFLGLGAAPPRRFTEQELGVLTVFARHAAITLENARLFEAEKRRAARISIINQVGRLIAANLDLEQLLQTTVEAIAEHLYYHNIALLLIDPADRETLVLRARSGLYAAPEVGGYRQKIDRGIIGAALQARRYLLINDVRRDPRYLSIPGGEPISAELAVPIIVGDRPVGALNIESEQPMSDEDAAGFEIIADQLGVAIENARLFAEIQGALAETQLLYQTSQRISTSMDVDEVIHAYLEQVAVRGRYACSAALYELDEQGRRTAVIVRGRWSPETGLVHLEERIPYSRDALDPPLDAGQTITVADVRADPRVPPGLRQLQIQEGRPALAFIPLMVRGERIGLVVLSDSRPHAWEPADLHPYQVTAAQLATSIDSRRQHYLLSERGQQIAVLKERQRLARDLHDSVTQLIFSMTLIAQSIAPAWRRDSAEGERRVNRLLELSQAALAEMRALLAELRPPDLPVWPAGSQPSLPLPGITQVQREGLVAALQSHAVHLGRDGLQVKLYCTDYVRQPFDREEALYRIAQEALNNVVKHARARCAELTLAVDRDSVKLKVTDDGSGFAPAPALPPAASGQARSGLGLTTMRERAEAFDGTVQLMSVPGSGTTVTATIPRGDRIS
ncbi:MAG: GAF domain-containing sensor histidine kinase [Anaerolineae bacterium]|nr:GAF domain-containing sensor histidine kinase [Anaerolineae bacterium]